MSQFEFSDLFKKITRREFIENHHDKSAYFEAGAIDDPGKIFSWDHMNDLLSRSKLWNADVMELALDGKVLAPARYCRPGMGRLGERALRPDREQIHHFLREGATLVLDFLEGIHPGIQDVAMCIERLTGTSTSANAYCSWKNMPGYASHFDTMCVFAIQLEGEKSWNIYQGRINEPMAIPGAGPSEFSREQHDRQKGQVARRIVMRPGDVLYLPRGLYHDALTTDTASLHVSFGATYLAGFSGVSMLAQELQREEYFRKRLPHFDDGEALSSYLTEVGRRVSDRMADPEFHGRVRDQILRNLADKVTGHRLPDRGPDRNYMVTRHEPRLVRRGPVWRLEFRGSQTDIAVGLVPVLENILAREQFWISDLSELSNEPEASVHGLLNELERLEVIWRLAG